MTPRPVLAALCAALLLLVAAQWLLPDGTGGGSDAAAPGFGGGGGRSGTAIASLGATALATKLLDRPLFLPGRHLPPPVIAAPVAPARKTIIVPRLTGVLLMSGMRIAVFEVAGQLKPITASVGDHVTDWVVTAITANSATISGAAGVRVLNPAPDPNNATDPPPDAADAGDGGNAADQ